MSIFNDNDAVALQDMLDEIRSMVEDLNVVGVAADENGDMINYLDQTDAGRRASRTLDNFQNFLEESLVTLEDSLVSETSSAHDIFTKSHNAMASA